MKIDLLKNALMSWLYYHKSTEWRLLDESVDFDILQKYLLKKPIDIKEFLELDHDDFDLKYGDIGFIYKLFEEDRKQFLKWYELFKVYEEARRELVDRSAVSILVTGSRPIL
jgi:hypothetical protein